MLTHAEIAALIPHQGAMCLLDSVTDYTAETIGARATSHLATANPLRRAGRLATICGCEYGFQAAALHGALLDGGRKQPPGFLVSLRIARIAAPYLDDPGFGDLLIEAEKESVSAAGLAYRFRLRAETGTLLLEARATIALPQHPGAPHNAS